MAEDYKSFKIIIRAFYLLGTTQSFQALVAVIRGKFTAAILGPVGMGINSLFQSSSMLLQQGASLGMNLAIVKEIATTASVPEEREFMVALSQRIILFTSILGALICIACSRWLSSLTFGSEAMSSQFLLLAAAVALSVAASGKLSLLQGAYAVRTIRRATILSGIIGLAAAVPLYLFMGTDGIVPAITASAFVSFVFFDRGVRKEFLATHKDFSWSNYKDGIIYMLLLGLAMMSGDFFAAISTYIINIFIQSESGEYMVGLYQAANSITLQYSGVIFSMLALDFFPRLTAEATGNGNIREMVNRQTEFVATVMSPLVILIMVSAPLIIRLLLSEEYLSATPLLCLMALGFFIKAVMTPTGYIPLAKGNRHVIFWLEGLGCNLLTLLLCCLFFRFWGLIGLGYAVIADNAICLITYLIINGRLYSFSFNLPSLRCIFIGGIFALLAFATTLLDSFAAIGSGLVVLTAAIWWAVTSLRRKVNDEGDSAI